VILAHTVTVKATTVTDDGLGNTTDTPTNRTATRHPVRP
jgi:hypothetical protein